MNFEEFKSNVEHWAEERGIYEHSTPDVQLLKTLSEIGELADAFIEGEPLEGKIGAVAVCLVSYAKMKKSEDFDMRGDVEKFRTKIKKKKQNQELIATIFYLVSEEIIYPKNTYKASGILFYLRILAYKNGLNFMSCCEVAWNEIKDRKGKMVAGGAFIKNADLV